MKEIFVTIMLFLFAVPIAAQGNLAIHLKRCGNQSQDLDAVEGFRIFHENSLFKEVKVFPSFAFYEKVPRGNYRIEIKNIFGEKVVKETKVENHETEVLICVDSLENPAAKAVFLEQIQNGETITINFRFAGCFADGADSIQVLKRDDKFYIARKGKPRELNASEVKNLAQYEKELRSLGRSIL